jgi:hypothetical protein
VSEDHIAGLLERCGENGILVAGRLQVSNFLQKGWRGAGRDFRMKFLQGCQSRVALWCGKCGVEGDYTRARTGQALHQLGI